MVFLTCKLEPVLLDPKEKMVYHLNTIFGIKDLTPDNFFDNVTSEYSRRTGRIKNFFIDSNLFATLRKDGGMAITIFAAKYLLKYASFKQNCVIASDEAIPFVSKGKSLFCKHVKWCGSNIIIGSDVAIINNEGDVIAVGKSMCHSNLIMKHQSSVAVKIREGIKSSKEKYN